MANRHEIRLEVEKGRQTVAMFEGYQCIPMEVIGELSAITRTIGDTLATSRVTQRYEVHIVVVEVDG